MLKLNEFQVKGTLFVALLRILVLFVYNQLSNFVLFGKKDMFLVALRTRSLFLDEGFHKSFDLSRDSYSDFDYL